MCFSLICCRVNALRLAPSVLIYRNSGFFFGWRMTILMALSSTKSCHKCSYFAIMWYSAPHYTFNVGGQLPSDVYQLKKKKSFHCCLARILDQDYWITFKRKGNNADIWWLSISCSLVNAKSFGFGSFGSLKLFFIYNSSHFEWPITTLCLHFAVMSCKLWIWFKVKTLIVEDLQWWVTPCYRNSWGWGVFLFVQRKIPTWVNIFLRYNLWKSTWIWALPFHYSSSYN